MNILKHKAKSLEVLVELLNTYPIFVVVLECWVRRKAILWLEQCPQDFSMGNEHEILLDLNLEVRGPLLGIIAESLKTSLKLKFEYFPTLDP